jgi:hypothetical protein
MLGRERRRTSAAPRDCCEGYGNALTDVFDAYERRWSASRRATRPIVGSARKQLTWLIADWDLRQDGLAGEARGRPATRPAPPPRSLARVQPTRRADLAGQPHNAAGSRVV